MCTLFIVSELPSDSLPYGELIKNLQKQIKELELKTKKVKNPTKPNKQKVGFLKKHKYKK